MIRQMYGNVIAPYLLKYRDVTRLLLERESRILEIMNRVGVIRDQAEILATPGIRDIGKQTGTSMSTVQNVKRVMQNIPATA